MNYDIFLFGDSVLYGQGIDYCLRWSYTLGNKLSQKFFNYADSNFNTNLGIINYKKIIENSKPNIIVIQYCYKDCLDEINPDIFKKNIKEMIFIGRKNGIKEILLLTTHNITGYFREYNEKIRELAEEKNLKLIDFEKYFKQMSKSEINSFIQSDEIHLNINGHKLYSDIMEYEILNSLKINLSK